MTYENIGSALLIIGAGYLYFVYHLNEWFVLGMVILALLTITYPGYSKERKKLLEAQLEMTRAKTDYYRSKSR